MLCPQTFFLQYYHHLTTTTSMSGVPEHIMDDDLMAEIDVLMWLKVHQEVMKKQVEEEAEVKRKADKEAERK